MLSFKQNSLKYDKIFNLINIEKVRQEYNIQLIASENYSSYYENHEVLVSEDYSGDVAAATWTELADGVS